MVIHVLERVGELDIIIILGWSHLWRFPKRLRHISTVKLFAKNSETSRCYFADDQTTDDKMLVPEAFIKIDQPRFVFTYISTLSTLIPHGSVASSKAACKTRGYTHFSWLELSGLGGKFSFPGENRQHLSYQKGWDAFDVPTLSNKFRTGAELNWMFSSVPLYIADDMFTCMEPEMLSLSLRISWRFFVPRIFRNVVWARSRVEWWAFSTLATDTVAFDTLDHTGCAHHSKFWVLGPVRLSFLLKTLFE